jgi:hypothetical protein
MLFKTTMKGNCMTITRKGEGKMTPQKKNLK